MVNLKLKLDKANSNHEIIVYSKIRTNSNPLYLKKFS